jgi:hypothetical protein
MSLSDAMREIEAVNVGRDVHVEAILRQIQNRVRGDPDSLPRVSSDPTTMALKGETVDTRSAEDDFGQAVVRAIAQLRRQSLDHQASIDTIEEWVRAETEWNARLHHDVCARLDRLTASLDAVAARTQAVGDRLDQLERRLDRDLTATRTAPRATSEHVAGSGQSEPSLQPDVSDDRLVSPQRLLAVVRGRWRRFR